MEFKDAITAIKIAANAGLIESDWNLKLLHPMELKLGTSGLIESDWNLKYKVADAISEDGIGLIESDWNLK